MKYFFCFPLLFLFSNYSSLVKERTKKPFIQFKSTNLPFDTVQSGIILKGEFGFKNTGDEPLIILTVQASDGGTITNWPMEPVKPGAEDIITVQFNTQGRAGYQDKYFTVISNAEDSVIVLRWKGYIVKGE